MTSPPSLYEAGLEPDFLFVVRVVSAEIDSLFTVHVMTAFPFSVYRLPISARSALESGHPEHEGTSSYVEMANLKTRSVLAFVVAPFLMMVEGHPTYRLKLPNAFSNQFGQVQNSNVGHTGGFRYEFQASGLTWTRAFCQADSDGDGQSNGLELGDPCCTWTQGSVAAFTTDLSYPGDANSRTSRTMPSCGAGSRSPPPPSLFSNPETGAVPGRYESYVFALAWQPTRSLDACPGQSNEAPGVIALTTSTLNIHGLWPKYDPAHHAGYTWPQNCGEYQSCSANQDSGSFCPPQAAVYSAFNVSSKWHTYALEYGFSLLATREWATHGSCTPWALPNHTAGQQGYFAKQEELYNLMLSGEGWDLLHRYIGSSVSATGLRAAFARDAGGAAPAIRCTPCCRLSEVWLGMAADTDLEPILTPPGDGGDDNDGGVGGEGTAGAWQGVDIHFEDTCGSCASIELPAWTGCSPPTPPCVPDNGDAGNDDDDDGDDDDDDDDEFTAVVLACILATIALLAIATAVVRCMRRRRTIKWATRYGRHNDDGITCTSSATSGGSTAGPTAVDIDVIGR